SATTRTVWPATAAVRSPSSAHSPSDLLTTLLETTSTSPSSSAKPVAAQASRMRSAKSSSALTSGIPAIPVTVSSPTGSGPTQLEREVEGGPGDVRRGVDVGHEKRPAPDLCSGQPD